MNGIGILCCFIAFAAILGAIPFVGTYWAALPAVLELCLIHREIFLGLLLAVFHVLPSFVVDTAIYSDIKGYAQVAQLDLSYSFYVTYQ